MLLAYLLFCLMRACHDKYIMEVDGWSDYADVHGMSSPSTIGDDSCGLMTVTSDFGGGTLTCFSGLLG